MKQYTDALLRTLLLAAASVLVPVAAGAGEGVPKYIFYFIGDGMGMNQALSAMVYNRQSPQGHSGVPLMQQFPVASQCTTHSASSPVTDSAAAGTALATGHKTRNGMLGMDADSIPVQSLAARLHDAGYGVALVTSVAPDDATPAAFYAHVSSRKMYYEIGTQMAADGYEFQAGSHLRGLKDADGKDTDLPSHFARHGVAIAHGLEALDTIASRKVLLLDKPRPGKQKHIGFTIDSIPGALTLPAMTAAALKHMQRVSPERFFIMVEGGNIDYGGHAGDAGAIVKEVVNFNEALAHAWNFHHAHPDETLIVVTADHETGGMALGNRALGYDLHLGRLDRQRVSKDRFADHMRSVGTSRTTFDWPDMQEYLRDMLGLWEGLPVTEEQARRLEEEFERCFHPADGQEIADRKTLYNSFNTFTDAVWALLDSLTGVAFTTSGHTGAPVPVYAAGHGCEIFSPLNDNTDLPRKIASIAGVEL